MINKKGFTLVEVAIVLIIAGILFAAISSLLLIYMNQVQLKTTRQRMAAIDESLQIYLNLNGRYPCPADLTAMPDTTNFGVEISNDCGSLSGSVDGTSETSGNTLPPNNFDVRIGTVPVRTLNLPDEFIADAWGQRFTYAVTERLATSGTYDRDEGAVDVIDSAGNYVVNPTRNPAIGLAHYVVVSHGKNASGGTPAGGGSNPIPCVASDLDGENCNGDSIFRRTMLYSTGSNPMDDLIAFRGNNSSLYGQEIPARAVMAFNAHACPNGWVPFGNADGRVIIGADSTNYSLGDMGGEAEITTQSEEVGVEFLSPGNRLDLNAIITTYPGGDAVAIPGTASPQENRMPYIALIYCEKTG